MDGSWERENKRHPVDLDLELVLGKMPRKVKYKVFCFTLVNNIFKTHEKFIFRCLI